MKNLLSAFIFTLGMLHLSYAYTDELISPVKNPTIPAAVPTPKLDPLISDLIAISGCDPKLGSVCTYTITDPLIFLKYLTKCNLLQKWTIIYSPMPTQTVSITASSTDFCSLELANSVNNKKVICPITQANTQDMASPAAIASLENFKNTPGAVMPAQTMETIFKPIDDCLKRNIPSELRSLAHPNVDTVNLPPDFRFKKAGGNTQ